MPKNGIVQWGWSELEELLQCPVCLDIPAVGVVEQCRHGHHICANCKGKVESCPLCKCDFHGTRNFVVEELIRHYEILKNTMMLSNIVTETKAKKKGKLKLNATAPVFVPRRKVNTPNASKGLYPCLVGDCDVKLPSARLLNHVRTHHPDVLTESVVDFTDSYSQTLEIPYKNKKPLNKNTYVIFVRGIGLIYLIIEILRSGYVIVAVQTAMKLVCAQEILACLEFFSDSVVYTYNTRLISVRDHMPSLLQKKMCYTLNKNQLRSICADKKFKCKIRLSRFNNFDVGVLTPPDVEQIDIIRGIRASLVVEEKDRKLVKELEEQKASGSGSGKSTKPTGSKKHVAEANSDFESKIKKLEDKLKVLADCIFDKRDTFLNSNSNNREAVSPSTTANRTEPVPPSNVVRSETGGRRRRNNRNRRNRGLRNGSASSTNGRIV